MLLERVVEVYKPTQRTPLRHDGHNSPSSPLLVRMEEASSTHVQWSALLFSSTHPDSDDRHVHSWMGSSSGSPL